MNKVNELTVSESHPRLQPTNLCEQAKQFRHENSILNTLYNDFFPCPQVPCVHMEKQHPGDKYLQNHSPELRPSISLSRNGEIFVPLPLQMCHLSTGCIRNTTNEERTKCTNQPVPSAAAGPAHAEVLLTSDFPVSPIYQFEQFLKGDTGYDSDVEEFTTWGEHGCW